MTFETDISKLPKWAQRLIFQSSFSEYDLWNRWMRCLKLIFYTHLSILVFWVWPLKRVIKVATPTPVKPFNPHFLSMTFETSEAGCSICPGLWLSILIFWVWPLKRVEYWRTRRDTRSLSILIFWVWPLKRSCCGPLRWYTISFNPHFLSMTFETAYTIPSFHCLKTFPYLNSMTPRAHRKIVNPFIKRGTLTIL